MPRVARSVPMFGRIEAAKQLRSPNGGAYWAVPQSTASKRAAYAAPLSAGCPRNAPCCTKVSKPLPWYKSFFISIAMHAVLVIVIAIMPPIKHDPMRLLQPRPDKEVIKLADTENQRVVSLWQEPSQVDEGVEDDGDALPAFAQEEVPVEPVFEGAIQKKTAEVEPEPETVDSEPETTPVAKNQPSTQSEKRRIEKRETQENLPKIQTPQNDDVESLNIEDATVTRAQDAALGEQAAQSGAGVALDGADGGQKVGAGDVGTAPNVEAPKGTGVSGGGEGTAGQASDEKQLWSAYVRTVSAMFQQKKRPYPEMAKRLGQQGTVVLDITLARDGKVLKTAVYTSSGSKILDDAALSFAQKATYPPFPQGITLETKVLRAPIIYSLKKK